MSANLALPVGFRPEGITSGPGTTFYAGSVSNGAVWRGDLRTGTGGYHLPATTGRSRGLPYDPRTGLVWAVGNDSSGSKAWAVNARNGVVVRVVDVPGATFLNDLVVTERAVWVTDSRVDRLTRIPLPAAGQPCTAVPTYVPLSGAWPTTTSGFGANGIRKLAGGELILNNSNVGGLYAVDPETGEAKVKVITGGAAIVSGDGLELRGHTLYDVTGTGASTVSVLMLRHEDSERTATNRGEIGSPLLEAPSTATLALGALYAVNARFGVTDPDTATYSVTRLPLRP